MKFSTVLFLLAIFLCPSCEKEDLEIDISCAPEGFPLILQGGGQAIQLANSMENFGWSLFQNVVENEEKEVQNQLISPLSIATAFYLAVNGAKGLTKQEIQATLGIDKLSLFELNQSFYQLQELLMDLNMDTDLQMANAMFWDYNKVEPKQLYVDSLCRYYELHTSSGDFEQDKEAMLDQINLWVSDATNGKIQDLFKDIEDDEVLFLINAIYFKSQWESPFEESSTRDRPFYLSTKEVIQVPTLSQEFAYRVFEHPQMTILELPFVDSLYHMHFILPPLEENVREWVANTEFNQVKVTLESDAQQQAFGLHIPKFKIKSDLLLNENLQDLGIRTGFSDLADFSNLATPLVGTGLYLNRVVHQASLEVNESGVEAAAVTGVSFSIRGGLPSLHFNRPFVAIISHKKTNTPLFISLIENPTL